MSGNNSLQLVHYSDSGSDYDDGSNNNMKVPPAVLPDFVDLSFSNVATPSPEHHFMDQSPSYPPLSGTIPIEMPSPNASPQSMSHNAVNVAQTITTNNAPHTESKIEPECLRNEDFDTLNEICRENIHNFYDVNAMMGVQFESKGNANLWATLAIHSGATPQVIQRCFEEAKQWSKNKMNDKIIKSGALLECFEEESHQANNFKCIIPNILKKMVGNEAKKSNFWLGFFENYVKMASHSHVALSILQQIFNGIKEVSFGVNSTEFDAFIFDAISFVVMTKKNIVLRILSDEIKTTHDKKYNLGKMIKEIVKNGLFDLDGVDVRRLHDSIPTAYDFTMFLGSNLGISVVDKVNKILILKTSETMSELAADLQESTLENNMMLKTLWAMTCIFTLKVKTAETTELAQSLQKRRELTNDAMDELKKIICKESRHFKQIVNEHVDDQKQLNKDCGDDRVQIKKDCIEFLIRMYISIKDKDNNKFKMTQREFDMLAAYVFYEFVVRKYPPNNIFVNELNTSIKGGEKWTSRDCQNALKYQLYFLEEMLCVNDDIRKTFLAERVKKNEKVNCTLLRQIFIDRSLGNKDKKKCYLHSPEVALKDPASTVRHCATVHGITIGRNGTAVPAPWFYIIKMNKKREYGAPQNHILKLNLNHPNEVKLKEKAANSKKFSTATDLFMLLLGENVHCTAAGVDCGKKDEESMRKNGINYLTTTGCNMTSILKISKQRYKSKEGKKLQIAEEQWKTKYKMLLSGNDLFSAGFGYFVYAMYKKQTSMYQSLSAELSLFEARLFDELYVKAADVDVKKAMIECLEKNTKSAVATAFCNVLPKRKSIKEFILRYYAHYIQEKLELSFNSALLNGLDIEKDLSCLSLNVDATFSKAAAMFKDGEYLQGVELTILNQYGQFVRSPMIVAVENGQVMIDAVVELYEFVLKLGLKKNCTHFIFCICIDDTTRHKNLPSRIEPEIENIKKSIDLSKEINVEIALRECGWHVSRRWKELPEHGDKALVMKCVRTTHLFCERGAIEIQKAPMIPCEYKSLHWKSLWMDKQETVQRELWNFVTSLSKVVDNKWQYNEEDFQCLFSEEVEWLLFHCIQHLQYYATHFLGTYVFFNKLPKEFGQNTFTIKNDNGCDLFIELPSLPRFIFVNLCEKIHCSNVCQPMWQNAQHLFGEWVLINEFFSMCWNDYNAKKIPIQKLPAFSKRWNRETSDDALLTQLNNRLNTNPKLWGNANTNEAAHSYGARCHNNKTPQSLSLKQMNVNVIAGKLNEIKAFKAAHKPSRNLNIYDEANLYNLRDKMLKVLKIDSKDEKFVKLKQPAPEPSLHELQKKGFKSKVKYKQYAQNRKKTLMDNGRGNNIKKRVKMVNQDRDTNMDGTNKKKTRTFQQSDYSALNKFRFGAQSNTVIALPSLNRYDVVSEQKSDGMNETFTPNANLSNEAIYSESGRKKVQEVTPKAINVNEGKARYDYVKANNIRLSAFDQTMYTSHSNNALNKKKQRQRMNESLKQNLKGVHTENAKRQRGIKRTRTGKSYGIGMSAVTCVSTKNAIETSKDPNYNQMHRKKRQKTKLKAT